MKTGAQRPECALTVKNPSHFAINHTILVKDQSRAMRQLIPETGVNSKWCRPQF